jgi:hypothetical protein
MYIYINENAIGLKSSPVAKKKNKMREQYAEKQQVRGSALSCPHIAKIAGKIFFTNYCN